MKIGRIILPPAVSDVKLTTPASEAMEGLTVPGLSEGGRQLIKSGIGTEVCETGIDLCEIESVRTGRGGTLEMRQRLGSFAVQFVCKSGLVSERIGIGSYVRMIGRRIKRAQ